MLEFFLGVIVGGVVGIVFMCIFQVGAAFDRNSEKLNKK